MIVGNYIRAVPTINLTDDEYAAVTAAIRRAIEDDRFPHAARLDPLRSALAKLEPATAPKLTPRPSGPSARPRRQTGSALDVMFAGRRRWAALSRR